MTNGWMQIAQEALKVPGLLVEIYGDLARPGVKQAGRALETIVGLGNTVLWPVMWANERSRIALERNLEKYRKEMEFVPEEKTVGVAPEIGVPIAEKLGYVQDETLSDLYIKLLATASNSDLLADAHPSYVNIINNLSPDEAQFLKYFTSTREMPLIKARAVGSDGSHLDIAGPFAPETALSSLVFPQNVDAYLSNLSGLGVLETTFEFWLTDPNFYMDMETKLRPQLAQYVSNATHLAGRTLELKRGFARRTSLGRNFIAACQK